MQNTFFNASTTTIDSFHPAMGRKIPDNPVLHRTVQEASSSIPLPPAAGVKQPTAVGVHA